MKALLLTVSSIVLASAGVVAMVEVQSARADAPPPLPPEAYAACESRADGDTCTVQLHDRTIHGTCAPDREGKGLFCRPDDMPPPPVR
jgi:hypothetical protein